MALQRWKYRHRTIAGATDSSYTLVAADEGNTIKVRVDFTDRGGYSESLTSAVTASVTSAVEGSSGEETPQNSPATGAPTITGTAQVGETLTADTSGIADERRADQRFLQLPVDR